MTELEQLHLLRALSSIRAGCIKHLHIGHSLIPYDILVEVIQFELEHKELSLKELFCRLPYSEMGIRYHIQKLTIEGWIETNGSNADKRVKNIRPKEMLRIEFALLGKSLKSLLI